MRSLKKLHKLKKGFESFIINDLPIKKSTFPFQKKPYKYELRSSFLG